MLDYAANGLSHWSMERLPQAAAETAKQRGRTLDAEMQTLLADLSDVDVEGYWQRVEQNLRTGKVRLLFVADSIPPALRRLVEFLNEKMDDLSLSQIPNAEAVGLVLAPPPVGDAAP